MLELLSGLLKKSRFETMKRKGVNRAVTAHKSILSAVIERNPDRASQEMHRHLKMAKQDLKWAEKIENFDNS